MVPPILGIFLVRKATFSALFSLFLNFFVPCFSRFDAKTPFLALVGEFFLGDSGRLSVEGANLGNLFRQNIFRQALL